MKPGPRLLHVLWLWVGLGVATAWRADLEPVWLGAGLVLLAVAAGDAVAGWRLVPPRALRKIPHSLPLGVWGDVRIRVYNDAVHPVRVAVFDHFPDANEVQGLPQQVRVPARAWIDTGYRLLPKERGTRRFGRVQMYLSSPLQLWLRNLYGARADEVRVYPNFAAVARYALLATDNRLSQMGIRKRRRRGEGLEFHQLREYRAGDSLRQVDWKATSRLGKLISREYQAERDQQVFFLIDCGRRMMARDGDLSHFDHSLNSVLLLAYVALRQGDAVGLMTFSGAARYLAPRKGGTMLNTVLNTLYDLQPGMHSPDYVRAAAEVRKRLRKRSLVIIVTNMRDEDTSEVLPALGMLHRHHLVLLASLRERIISDVLRRPIVDFDAALTLAATQRYLLARRKAHDALGDAGALSLDVEPERLPITLVNRYLDIKSSGRL